MARKLALIGYGGMAGWHHDNIKNKVLAFEVVGAFDVRPEALENAVKNGIKAYSSQAELLADKDVEIVTIATPNNFHKDIAVAALMAGKHVVCEKPVTLNAGELREIMAAAKEAGRLFSVHQNRRWDKDFRIVKKAVDGGLLGDVYFVESRVQGSNGKFHGWRNFKENGGGMLLDWGVHLIDQLMDMFPVKVTSVSATLLGLFSDEVDDNIKFTLTFENGVTAMVEITTNCLVNLPRWHVEGGNGTLVVDDWSCGGKIVKIKEGATVNWEDVIVYTEAGPTRTMAPRPEYSLESFPLPDVKTDWAEYYKNIAETLDGKAELIVKPEQCLRVMSVIDKLFESGAKGHGLPCEI